MHSSSSYLQISVFQTYIYIHQTNQPKLSEPMNKKIMNNKSKSSSRKGILLDENNTILISWEYLIKTVIGVCCNSSVKW